jgi:signal transduction histidine kinase
MQSDSWVKNYGLPGSLFLGFWTVIGLAFASQFYLSSALFGYYTVTWGQAISITLGDWYVWAVLSLAVLWFARRFPLHRRDWGKRVVIHLAASAVICILYSVVRAAVGQLQAPLLGMPATFLDTLQRLFLKNSFFNLLIYWVIVAVGHAFDYYRKFREREWRTSELERRLAEAKLMALQMQLNPHFLFNTLHTISALLHKDVEAADRMIARLSELLRLALENADTNEVPLRQELDFLRRYLEIEQTRFGSRLTVRFDLAPEALEAQVPNLVLQPLVENAIRHGIEPQACAGLIEVRAWRDHGRLQLEVRDNGTGLAAGKSMDGGVGVSNTRARLQHLYGHAHSLDFTHAPGGGLVVRLALPFRGPPPPAPAASSPGAAVPPQAAAQPAVL